MSSWQGPPEGVDRRRRNPELDAVLERMSSLEGATARLAVVLPDIVPDQIRVGLAELRKLLFQVWAALAVLGVVLMVYSVVTVNRLNTKIERGHDVLSCFLKVPEASRTDVALLTCKQAER